MHLKKNLLLVAFGFMLFYLGCSNVVLDEVTPGIDADCTNDIPTWDNGVSEIVRLTCTNPGCHNGISGVRGDYRTYEGISSEFGATGGFNGRVFLGIGRPMPEPGSAGEMNLSEERKAVLLCWSENNFPEN